MIYIRYCIRHLNNYNVPWWIRWTNDIPNHYVVDTAINKPVHYCDKAPYTYILCFLILSFILECNLQFTLPDQSSRSLRYLPQYDSVHLSSILHVHGWPCHILDLFVNSCVQCWFINATCFSKAEERLTCLLILVTQVNSVDVYTWCDMYEC